MRRPTYATKARAIRAARTGRRVYRAAGGYRVSPECPRAAARRRSLIRHRTASRRPVRRRGLYVAVKWLDTVPF
ncbi:MAG: hypothetical protein JW993_10260 [Sedimentisphaerales bacterium]|nr:hypothetical protein [Sedimentisphaerales bacterium]